MRLRTKLLTLALFLTPALCGGGRPPLSAASVLAQSEDNVTAAEREEVQAIARRFVSRMIETRDVAPLVGEFFLSDFTSFFRQDFYEKVSPRLYATLTSEERARLFIAQENLGYLITLHVLLDRHTAGEAHTPFAEILPGEIARRLNASRLVEGSAEFTDHGELMKELSELEKALAEARRVLSAKNLEQSPAFRKRFDGSERDLSDYTVSASVIEEDDSATEERAQEVNSRFGADRKVFRVETPLFINIILVRDRGQYKILTLEPE